MFRAVARHESFTRAAEELFISQPAVSAHVRELERHYGVELFEPVGRRVRLTEGGRLVAPVGDADMQELVVRDARGHEERYGAVRFVPLRGRAGFS